MNQEEYNVHFQGIRELYVRISLLNNNNIKIGEIQGNALSGSIDIKSDNPIRRTCNIGLTVTDSSFLIGENKKIWIDKRIRIEIGIRSLISNEIVYFNKGIYIVNQPSLKYNSTEKTLEFEGLDLMCNVNGTFRGIIEDNVVINNGINISTAIQTTAQSLGNINQSNIENIEKATPYKIEKQMGDTVYSILEELKNLYKDWELFFDEDGVLIFQRIKNRINDPIQLDFASIDRQLIMDYSVDYKFDNVRNKIIVYGKLLDNGTQVKSVLFNTDTNSPFNINKPLGIIPLIINNDKIFTQEQAEAQANYELWKHNNLCETINITCLPFYFLDVNKVVNFNLPEIELQGRYLITDISFPIGIGNMTFNAYKIY